MRSFQDPRLSKYAQQSRNNNTVGAKYESEKDYGAVVRDALWST